jgi:hypothetical protein
LADASGFGRVASRHSLPLDKKQRADAVDTYWNKTPDAFQPDEIPGNERVFDPATSDCVPVKWQAPCGVTH